MAAQISIGPIPDIKTLIEALPLIRKLSYQHLSIVLTPSATPLRTVIKSFPNIADIVITNLAQCTLDLRKIDIFETISSLDNVYIYPWIYFTWEERADASKHLSTTDDPVIVIIKDHISHGLFLKIKKWLRESLSIEAEPFTFYSSKSLRHKLLQIIKADLAISAATEEALMIAATGTPIIVITEEKEKSKTLFRAFLPPKSLKIRDEFGPQIQFCTPEKDKFLAAVKLIIPKNKAIFFDRDGTLCEDVNYLKCMEELNIFPEVHLLTALKDRGFLLIGVTNQSGIARGIVPSEVNETVNKLFVKKYYFDDFYYCPHHPDENCACRKPSPGMLFKARRNHAINLRKSIVVGDKDSDMLLAKAVGAKAVLVKTGKQKHSIFANNIIDNLAELLSLKYSE